MTRILPSALSWEKSWRTPANTAMTTTTAISIRRTRNVLFDLTLIGDYYYERSVLCFIKKNGVRIHVSTGSMTRRLSCITTFCDTSLASLYEFLVVVSSYLTTASRRLPPFETFNTFSQPELSASIGIIILCIILQTPHPLVEFKLFNANLYTHLLIFSPLCLPISTATLDELGRFLTCAKRQNANDEDHMTRPITHQNQLVVPHIFNTIVQGALRLWICLRACA